MIANKRILLSEEKRFISSLLFAHKKLLKFVGRKFSSEHQIKTIKVTKCQKWSTKQKISRFKSLVYSGFGNINMKIQTKIESLL